MDSVLGSLWMVGVVVMSGGLAMVGITQETQEAVYVETRSLVWGDGHGGQLGDVLELEHVDPAGARVLVSYDGGSGFVQLERGDRLWFPCPSGADDWITFTVGDQVVEQRRVTGCSGSGAGGAPPATTTDDDGSGEPDPWCPDGHEELDGFVCIPKLDGVNG